MERGAARRDALTAHSTRLPHLGLTYTPNTTRWRVGDFVIHEADTKQADMLMVVTGCSRDGVYRTRYAFPDQQPRSWRRKVWRNTLEPLQDPSRFGIAVSAVPLTSASPVSGPRRSAAVPPRRGPSARS